MYPTRPAAFAYHAPASLDEALDLLAGDDVRPLAGGHSLLPAMKLRLAAPGMLVDLGGLSGLDGISREGDRVAVGALARHAAVAASDVVRQACPVLAQAAASIGDRQVRNRGTIGGSLAHADPGADYSTVVAALGGTIVATGKGGEREIPAADFFTGVFTTALTPGELITAVRVPAVQRAVYLKHRHPASGYAVVGVAAVATDGEVRLAVGGVAGVPATVGVPLDGAAQAAAPAIAESVEAVIGDTYASPEYRLHLAGVLARRAVEALPAQE
ncbi:MAG TPA: xanthine dehydrogenase family protein subunit M [Gaiellaceae bacterium]|nr:xanthine dehydrogenase family protein subunit M [Gaiellaceae bacterium]